MKFFRLLQNDINVAPLLDEIDSQESAWRANTARQRNIKVQRDTNNIILRRAAIRPDLALNENQECDDTGISKHFPKALAFMHEVANSQGGTLSRATIVRLKPQSSVGTHTDSGSYYLIRDRFHLVLRSPSGSLLRAGDEECRMFPGQLWWFDNKQHHNASNNSDIWRIHYIFDVLPQEYAKLGENPLPLSELPKEIQALSPKKRESVLSRLSKLIYVRKK